MIWHEEAGPAASGTALKTDGRAADRSTDAIEREGRLMGSKVKCPGCGAKNDAAAYRCRICTAMIDPDGAKPPVAEPTADPSPMADHFDAGEIQRQVQAPRERFS